MVIRFAKEDELERINVLRKQVNDLHVEGKPDVFKPGFNEELQNYVYYIFKDPEQKIVVADKDGEICGFAILHHIYKPENPFMKVRDFLDIDEFCVDEKHRREGIATAMVEFIKNFAKEQGYHRLELNMWEFNQDALAFYEAAGFETFRRYMEMFI
ncbi:MAG: GNAT family N-acetyltransferase [Clostridiales bacterium]|nr:GNAT family N-acetyltransferase [Clostridiales bacterium]